MRKKNDLIIKYYQEQHLSSLTLEERGILFSLLFIIQDTENIRFEKMTEQMKEILRQDEAETIAKREQLPANRKACFEMAFSMINGQAEYSKQQFNKLQESYDKKDDRIETKTKTDSLLENQHTIEKTYTFKVGDKIYQEVLRVSRENKDNIPSIKDFEKLDIETIQEIIKRGNADEWFKTVDDYIDEIDFENLKIDEMEKGIYTESEVKKDE